MGLLDNIMGAVGAATGQNTGTEAQGAISILGNLLQQGASGKAATSSAN